MLSFDMMHCFGGELKHFFLMSIGARCDMDIATLELLLGK